MTDPDYDACVEAARRDAAIGDTGFIGIGGLVRATIDTLRQRGWTPHYFSTYCIHDNHADCRLDCKTCHSLCLCECHVENDAENRHDSETSLADQHKRDQQRRDAAANAATDNHRDQ